MLLIRICSQEVITMKKSYDVQGLHCANCALRLEKGLNKIEGVDSAVVSFATQKVVLEAADDQLDAILDKADAVAAKLDPDWKIVH